jgi:hypothetical protein
LCKIKNANKSIVRKFAAQIEIAREDPKLGSESAFLRFFVKMAKKIEKKKFRDENFHIFT